jgi:hypothetical protein
MKKLLLSGITAVALMASAPAQAADLNIQGETGLARTPLAMSLAPMQFAIAADYVSSDQLYIPIRGELGLPYGIEVGGSYQYVDLDDTTAWSLNGKWVLPKFVENLGLAVGGHYYAEEVGNFENDGHDLYAVASYTVPMGEGMAVVPSFGINWLSRTGDNDKDAIKWFGSLLFKAPRWAVGGEYINADEDVDGNLDGFYWFGGRFYLNPMITLQAGYLNNANWNDDTDFGDNLDDGVFHIGAQFAFGGAK